MSKADELKDLMDDIDRSFCVHRVLDEDRGAEVTVGNADTSLFC